MSKIQDPDCSFLPAGTKFEMMEQLRSDIRDFTAKKNLDKVMKYTVIFLQEVSPLVSVPHPVMNVF